MDIVNPLLPKKSVQPEEKPRQNIYMGDQFERIKHQVVLKETVALSDHEKETMSFPQHSLLKQALDRIPETTNVIIVFTPYHYAITSFGDIGAQKWAFARAKILEICKKYPNVTVLDFMIKSEITKYDGNYWDSIHYTQSIVPLYQELIYQGFRTRKSDSRYYICHQ